VWIVRVFKGVLVFLCAGLVGGVCRRLVGCGPQWERFDTVEVGGGGGPVGGWGVGGALGGGFWWVICLFWGVFVFYGGVGGWWAGGPGRRVRRGVARTFVSGWSAGGVLGVGGSGGGGCVWGGGGVGVGGLRAGEFC